MRKATLVSPVFFFLFFFSNACLNAATLFFFYRYGPTKFLYSRTFQRQKAVFTVLHGGYEVKCSIFGKKFYIYTRPSFFMFLTCAILSASFTSRYICQCSMPTGWKTRVMTCYSRTATCPLCEAFFSVKHFSSPKNVLPKFCSSPTRAFLSICRPGHYDSTQAFAYAHVFSCLSMRCVFTFRLVNVHF